MSRLCFGSLLNILYHARATNRVSNIEICRTLFNCYGLNFRDFSSTYSTKLKNGTEHFPRDLVDAVVVSDFEETASKYAELIIPLIKDNLKVAVVRAIKQVIRESELGDAILGYSDHYKASSLVDSEYFSLPELLASLFYYVIKQNNNKDFKEVMRNYSENLVASHVNSSEPIYFEANTPQQSMPLSSTVNFDNFNRVFIPCGDAAITNEDAPSQIHFYRTEFRNARLHFGDLQNYIVENVTGYVSSRATLNQTLSPVAGARAMLHFINAFNNSNRKDSILGELLVYSFLEQSLGAPKILSKFEIDTLGGPYRSASDAIHFLTGIRGDVPFKEFVFGTASVTGTYSEAIDAAFSKVGNIIAQSTQEYNVIDTTFLANIYAPADVETLKEMIIPQKTGISRPEMSFGIFLGYSLPNPSNATNRLQVNQLESLLAEELSAIKQYCTSKINELELYGYNFYVFILPFNNAVQERVGIVNAALTEVC